MGCSSRQGFPDEKKNEQFQFSILKNGGKNLPLNISQFFYIAFYIDMSKNYLEQKIPLPIF